MTTVSDSVAFHSGTSIGLNNGLFQSAARVGARVQ